MKITNYIFKYSTQLHLCDPWKMYYVFREICIYADNYDDEFIQKFGAIRFQEPIIKPFETTQVENIRNTFNLFLKEANEYIEYFEKKRVPSFICDVLIQTLMKLDYYVAPQGIMRTDLEKTISYMQHEDNSLHDKIEKGKSYLKKLSQLKTEEFDEILYVSDIFIPVKFASNHDDVKAHAVNQYETAKNEMGKSDFMGATLSMMYMFLYEFYYYYPEENDAITMTNAMTDSAGKPWNEAAQILWKAMDEIMTDKTVKQNIVSRSESSTARTSSILDSNQNSEVKEEKPKKSKGFLSKFFGK